MLEYLPYLPVNLMLGVYKIPQNSHIIGTHAVRDAKTYDTGVLIQFEKTGAYCLFCAGAVRSLDPRDVRRLLEKGE